MLIQELISQDFSLTGTGRYLRTREHDSLIIDTLKQLFFWNSQGIYGNINDYIIKVRKETPGSLISFDLFDKTVMEEVEEVKVDPELVGLFSRNAFITDYWTHKRGYTPETISLFKLGYDGEFWHTLPIYEDGEFVNFQCRSLDKKIKVWYKYSKPHPFNFSILPVTNWIVIAESPVDTIMLRQNGIPSVSQTAGSGNTSTFLLNFTKFIDKDIYIVYDNDLAGRTGVEKLRELFGVRAKGFTFNDFPEKYDITDYFKDGHTKDEFLKLIGKT